MAGCRKEGYWKGWEKGGPRAHHLMAGPRAELTLWGPCRV